MASPHSSPPRGRSSPEGLSSLCRLPTTRIMPLILLPMLVGTAGATSALDLGASSMAHPSGGGPRLLEAQQHRRLVPSRVRAGEPAQAGAGPRPFETLQPRRTRTSRLLAAEAIPAGGGRGGREARPGRELQTSVRYTQATVGALQDLFKAFSCYVPVSVFPAACSSAGDQIGALGSSMQCGDSGTGLLVFWCKKNSNPATVTGLKLIRVTGFLPPSASTFSGTVWSLETQDTQLQSSLSNLATTFPSLQYLRMINTQGGASDSLNDLASLVSLTYLKLDNGTVTGEMSPTWGANLVSLRYLYLLNMPINGSFPESISQLEALNNLQLQQLDLTGAIPDSLPRLSNLTTLQLKYLQLTGQIPDSLGALESLAELFLVLPGLTGVPDSLSLLSNLQALELGKLGILGSIPAVLGNISSLTLLDLHDMPLTGPFPGFIFNLTRLEILGLRRLTNLGGTVPEGLSKLQSLKLLTLQHCNISGSIPQGLGGISGLTSLSLGENALQGTLPADLQSLRELVNLDLSDNFLTGELLYIPLSMDTQGVDPVANVGENYFTQKAQVSDPAAWDNYITAGTCFDPTSDTEKCNRFCGAGNNTLPCSGIGTCVLDGADFKCINCSAGTNSYGLNDNAICSDKPPYQGPNVVAIGVGVAVGSLVLLALIFLFRKRILACFGIIPGGTQGTGGYRFSAEELSQATGNFSQGNFLGNGGFGEVYYGKLPERHAVFPGREVAVKRQRKDRSGVADMDFFQEAQILSTVRHRNVVELLGFCESRGDRFLVYEFVARGSLHGILRKLTPAPREETPLMSEVGSQSIFPIREDSMEATAAEAEVGGSRVASGSRSASAGAQQAVEGQDPEQGKEEVVLGWALRVRIALGAATGLRYLHNELNQEILHLDIKTDNILVDSDFNAKVADFGISKMRESTLADENADTPGTPGAAPLHPSRSSASKQSSSSSSVAPAPSVTDTSKSSSLSIAVELQRAGTLVTNRFHGTLGYADPAYFNTGTLTRKSDVYSFGIVLLELATGWFPRGLTHEGHPVSLPMKVFEMVTLHGFQTNCPEIMREDFAEDAAAPGAHKGSVILSSGESLSTEERPHPAVFKRFLCLGMWCCAFDRELRPLMDQVVTVLQEIKAGKWRMRGDLGEGHILGPEGMLEPGLWSPP